MKKTTVIALAWLLGLGEQVGAQPAKESRLGIDADLPPTIQLARMKASLESISTDGSRCTVAIKVYDKAEATKKCLPFFKGVLSLKEIGEAIPRLQKDVALNSEPRTRTELDSMTRTMLKITEDVQFVTLQLR